MEKKNAWYSSLNRKQVTKVLKKVKGLFYLWQFVQNHDEFVWTMSHLNL